VSGREQRLFSNEAVDDLIGLATRGVRPGSIKQLAEKHGHSAGSMASKLQQLRTRGTARDVCVREDDRFRESVRVHRQ
jgi:hypothetical protein